MLMLTAFCTEMEKHSFQIWLVCFRSQPTLTLSFSIWRPKKGDAKQYGADDCHRMNDSIDLIAKVNTGRHLFCGPTESQQQ